MITQTKEQYISPECEALDVRFEGMIALSGGSYPSWEEKDV